MASDRTSARPRPRTSLVPRTSFRPRPRTQAGPRTSFRARPRTQAGPRTSFRGRGSTSLGGLKKEGAFFGHMSAPGTARVIKGVNQ